MFHSYVSHYQAGYFWPWNLVKPVRCWSVSPVSPGAGESAGLQPDPSSGLSTFFAACNVLPARMPVPLQRDLRFWVADEVDERHLAGVIGFWFEKGQKSPDISFISVICGATHSMAISGTDLLEVPTIYKAYVREYPHKIWSYIVQYLHFRILKFPLTHCYK